MLCKSLHCDVGRDDAARKGKLRTRICVSSSQDNSPPFLRWKGSKVTCHRVAAWFPQRKVLLSGAKCWSVTGRQNIRHKLELNQPWWEGAHTSGPMCNHHLSLLCSSSHCIHTAVAYYRSTWTLSGVILFGSIVSLLPYIEHVIQQSSYFHAHSYGSIHMPLPTSPYPWSSNLSLSRPLPNQPYHQLLPLSLGPLCTQYMSGYTTQSSAPGKDFSSPLSFPGAKGEALVNSRKGNGCKDLCSWSMPSDPILSHVSLAPSYTLLLGPPNLMVLRLADPSSVQDAWSFPRSRACLNQSPGASKELGFNDV